MEGRFNMTNEELMAEWHSVQIKIDAAIRSDDWRAIDRYTDETMSLIKRMMKAGIDVQQVVQPC